MALYAIGDLHLSMTTDKPMDVFGCNWANHAEKLKEAFSELHSDDVTVLCGDLSWGIDLEEAREDFLFVDSLPGKKIILKGNHDYWWATVSKTKKFFSGIGVTTIDILNNNCFLHGDNAAICGTRGWFYEEESGSEHDKKILFRELGRLETSLKAAEDREKHVFLHYPPKYGGYECSEILDLLEQYSVKTCIYGHIHGRSLKKIFEGNRHGTVHKCVSADHVNFVPQLIME